MYIQVMKNIQPVCVITGQVIPPERVEALEFLGVPQDQWTVVTASTVQKKKAVIASENWDLIIADGVGEEGIKKFEAVNE